MNETRTETSLKVLYRVDVRSVRHGLRPEPCCSAARDEAGSECYLGRPVGRESSARRLGGSSSQWDRGVARKPPVFEVGDREVAPREVIFGSDL